MSGRDEIDARQHRCDEARLTGRVGVRGGRTFTVVEPDRAPVLTFEEAQAAAAAVHARWVEMLKFGNAPLIGTDGGWATIFAAGWDEVWAMRHRQGGQA